MHLYCIQTSGKLNHSHWSGSFFLLLCIFCFPLIVHLPSHNYWRKIWEREEIVCVPVMDWTTAGDVQELTKDDIMLQSAELPTSQKSSWRWAEVIFWYNCNEVTFTCQRWKAPNVTEFSMISKMYQICLFIGVAFPLPVTICVEEAACSNSFWVLLHL